MHPLILGRLHLLLWIVSKAPKKAVSKVYCSQGAPEKTRMSNWGPTLLLWANLP